MTGIEKLLYLRARGWLPSVFPTMEGTWQVQAKTIENGYSVHIHADLDEAISCLVDALATRTPPAYHPLPRKTSRPPITMESLL